MKKLKPILALVLVFLAGTVFGIVATRVVTRAIIRKVLTHPDLVRVKIERDLVHKLKLDASQEQKVHETLVETQQKLGALRKDFQPQFAQIVSNAQDQVAAVLTPEQREKFEKFKRDNGRFLPFSNVKTP